MYNKQDGLCTAPRGPMLSTCCHRTASEERPKIDRQTSSGFSSITFSNHGFLLNSIVLTESFILLVVRDRLLRF